MQRTEDPDIFDRNVFRMIIHEAFRPRFDVHKALIEPSVEYPKQDGLFRHYFLTLHTIKKPSILDINFLPFSCVIYLSFAVQRTKHTHALLVLSTEIHCKLANLLFQIKKKKIGWKGDILPAYGRVCDILSYLEDQTKVQNFKVYHDPRYGKNWLFMSQFPIMPLCPNENVKYLSSRLNTLSGSTLSYNYDDLPNISFPYSRHVVSHLFHQHVCLIIREWDSFFLRFDHILFESKVQMCFYTRQEYRDEVYICLESAEIVYSISSFVDLFTQQCGGPVLICIHHSISSYVQQYENQCLSNNYNFIFKDVESFSTEQICSFFISKMQIVETRILI
jgi:hypothetical protein